MKVKRETYLAAVQYVLFLPSVESKIGSFDDVEILTAEDVWGEKRIER